MDEFTRLRMRDPETVAAFRAAAGARIDARFPGIEERERLVDAALERALKASAEPTAPKTTLEAAAHKQGFIAAAEAVCERALARVRAQPETATPERAFFAKLAALSETSRQLARVAFVQRVAFAEAVPRLGVDGAALGAAVTGLRQLVEPSASSPPPADTPAYVRLPFLVSGHMAPDDALRVREYLGHSEPCRRAYRELDALQSTFGRFGPAIGDPHPDPMFLGALADGTALTGERRDSLAEHLRFCAGCEAVVSALRSTSPATGPATLAAQLDAPRARKRLAAALVAVSMLLPVGVHELARRPPRLEFGGEGIDLGAASAPNEARASVEVVASDPNAPVALTARVPIEPNVDFDLRLERVGSGEVQSEGGVPVEPAGASVGRVTIRLPGADLEPGEYRLHLLRRFRSAGGAPADFVFPFRVLR